MAVFSPRESRTAMVSLLLIAGLMLAPWHNAVAASKRGALWGANYFPNVELTTHEGKTVRFFDDLIKDKVVAINFIFTRCKNVCPLETAQMRQVQRLLGDRVGEDVFLYSITVDPEHDTPEVLKKYAESYQAGPGWTFLTGDEQDIISLRKKLGLYIEEIQGEDSTDHNVNLVIGNQRTGRWMKRSPFDNPQVLATQIGGWLHNWKRPSAKRNNYANAPETRPLEHGETVFRTRCASCHTIGAADLNDPAQQQIGPDLYAVTQKRERAWLKRWLAEPDKMLEERDPLALQLFAQYNNVVMPNLQLNERDIEGLMSYMEQESRRVDQRQ